MPYEISFTLPDDFTARQLGEFLTLNGKLMNQLIGHLLSTGQLTTGSPVIAALCQSSASIEQALNAMQPPQRPPQIAVPGGGMPIVKGRMN